MAPRILLVNLHSCRNAGDAALMLSAIQQLQRHFPGCRLTLAMNDTASYQGELPVVGSFSSWVKRPAAGGETWRWPAMLWLPVVAALAVLRRLTGRCALSVLPPARRDLVRAYLEADLVVSCPGGFLFTAGFGLPLVIAVYTMAVAWLAGKPLYILPQSIGPLERRWEQWLVGWLLRRARLVMVREPISLAALPLKANQRGHVHLLPDLALAFAGASRPAALAWLEAQGVELRPGRPCLGITAINWHAQNAGFQSQARYEAALAAAARCFVERCGGQVIFFPQVCGPTFEQDDRVPARRVAAQLGDLAPSLCVLEEAAPPALLKAVYELMDVFIGTRMHSNLFALTGGVPVVAIAYQFKTQGIARTLGIEEWVIDIRQVDAAGLTARLADLWSAREQVRAGLNQRLPALVRQAEQAGALMAADYEQWRQSRRR